MNLRFNILKKIFDDSTSRKTVFLHIPKTGGCTFRNVLMQVYAGSYNYCEHPDPGYIKQMLQQHDCVELHVGKFQGNDIYFHKDIIQEAHWPYLKNLNLFIMFRDPVDRVISNYFELSRKRIAEKREALPSLTATSLKESDHNKQVGFLLGNHPSAKKIPSREDLEYAKHLLDSLKIQIGILERYGESLQLFEHVSGKQIHSRTIQIQNETARSTHEMVDQKTREYIREKNLLDQDLYEFAIRKFDRQIADAGVGSEGEFTFERSNDPSVGQFWWHQRDRKQPSG